MIAIPPTPGWDSLHPLIIHFPIALLLVAPLFLLIGALRQPARGRPYLMVAFLLMLVGTAGAWFAVATGEAAGQLVERNAQVSAVLESHEDLAEATRTAFTILTVIFALLLFLPPFLNHATSRLTSTILPLVFLLFYGAGALLLANTGHQGGKLVHELGVSANPVVSDQALNDERRGD